jgi:hypothetical protein
MTDAQTIFEFRLACQKGGCPICYLVQRLGARYIEGTLNESLLDPVVRQKLLGSHGFCYEHTWRSIDLKLSDALGHAILFHDLIKDARNKLGGYGRVTGVDLADTLEPVTICPACQIEQAAADRIIDSIKSALTSPDFLAEFRQSTGICIPHLRLLLRSLDSERKAIVLEHQILCLMNLQDELAEFIRKSDYRFRAEVIGREGDSYKRAADVMMGKHRPSEKKDVR